MGGGGGFEAQSQPHTCSGTRPNPGDLPRPPALASHAELEHDRQKGRFINAVVDMLRRAAPCVGTLNAPEVDFVNDRMLSLGAFRGLLEPDGRGGP